MRWSTALLAAACLIGAGCGSARPEVKERAPDPVSEPASAWSAIGTSVEQREIVAGTFGRGRLRMYVIGGIHGNEGEGQPALDEIADAFANTPAGALAMVRIVRDANPDGTEAGKRGNARGVDLNRNWPARNFTARAAHGAAPLSEPETAAVHADLVAFRPHLVVVFHSIRSGPFVNFDGPGAEPAEVFAAAARQADEAWRVVPEMGYGTPGSIGSYIGRDLGIAILTIEFRRGEDAESARLAAVEGLLAITAVSAGR